MAADVDGPLVVEMLPARHGDALLLTWGPPGERGHLLVDGGPATAFPEVRSRLVQVAAEGLDLMVLTHIDADHIEGALLVANDAGLDIGIREFWFNGPAQLTDELGPAQGEMLAALIAERGIPHNKAFGGGAVRSPNEGALDVVTLRHGLTVTVLGPDAPSLRRLSDVWFTSANDDGLVFESRDAALEELRRRTHGPLEDPFLSGEAKPDVLTLAGRSTPKDSAAANRSSIVLLVEYRGVAVLLTGDATPAALTSAVRRLLTERGIDRLDLRALKLPHHGSSRNITPELLRLLPADHYLFSSDGAKFGHPDDIGVARCLVHGKAGGSLEFNYRTPQTMRWNSPELLSPRGYRATYPAEGSSGLALSLPVPTPTG